MRFSPKFAETLRKKVGDDRRAFVAARRAFTDWCKSESLPVIISPFCSHYVAPIKVDLPDCARDCTSEYYEGPFSYPDLIRETPVY